MNAGRLERRFQREWLHRDVGGNLVSSADVDGHDLPRRTIRWRATRVWLVIFLLLAALDIGLAVWAVYDWLDLSWFADDEPRRRFPSGDD